MVLCLGSKDTEPQDEFDALPFSLRWRMHFGKREKDPHSGQDILRLSSNKIIQTHCESTEYQALKLVDRHTSVPTYKVLGVYNRPEGKLVEYEAIPGKPLSEMWDAMSAEKKRRIVGDLGRYVDQLRKMEPPKHCVVGDATHGAAYDHRFGRGKVGPFYTIEAFHDFIRRGHPVKEFTEDDIQTVHGSRQTPYVLKFTHAQLCPKNILVDDAGRISAIIGWESSGWYPEYWEYTKMHAETPRPQFEEWLIAMRKVIPRYDVELNADVTFRERYTSAAYDRPRSVRPPSPSPSELRREIQEIDDKNTESTSG